MYSFWYLDSPGALEDNGGYATHLNYLSSSQTLELYGRFHANLFNSDKKLFNGVDMNIKLTCAPETFYLLATSYDTKVCMKILDVTIFITQV